MKSIEAPIANLCEKLGDARTLIETKSLRLQGVLDRVNDLFKQAEAIKAKILAKKRSLRATM